MLEALKKINKNKAIGVDNMTLKPLDKKQILSIKKDGFTYEESNLIWKKKMTKKVWREKILEGVPDNICKYYNYCLEEKKSLLYK